MRGAVIDRFGDLVTNRQQRRFISPLEEPDEEKTFCPTGPGGGVDPTCGSGSKLSARQVDILETWTAGNHTEIQSAEKGSGSEDADDFNAYLDTKVKYAGVVYRGLITDKSEMSSRDFKVGGVVSFDVSSSATKDRKVAVEEFANSDLKGKNDQSLLFRMRTKTAADIESDVKEHNPSFSHQREVVVRKQTQFKILGIGRDVLGVDYLVTLEEL